MSSRVQHLLDLHHALLQKNPYCYFELAYTRQTGWMAWICSKPQEDDPNRKVIAQGQGISPEDACEKAVSYFCGKTP